MQLELPVRWEEQEEIDRDRYLVEGEDYKVEKKYTYGRLLINSEEIGPYYDIDPLHTMINDSLGKIYTVVIPLEDFKKIMVEYTGKAILKIKAVTIIPNPGNPDSSDSSDKSTDDGIIFD